MNFGCENHFCLDSKVALAQASDKQDENHVSDDDGENGSRTQPGKLALQRFRVARQARWGPLRFVYEIFREKVENTQCHEVAIPSKNEGSRISDREASGERH